MINALIIATSLFIFYTYFGYPMALAFLAKCRRRPQVADPAFTPHVSVVIAAFNEEDCIGETLTSILASAYPTDRLDVVVVSDASSDRTDAIVASFPSDRVHLKRQTERKGQSIGHRDGAQSSRGDLLIIADASGRFFPDTVRTLARHFADPRVGAVSGHKVMRDTGSAAAKGDGFYLRYDTALRSLESQTGASWVGCQGGLFAIRKPLYTADFPPDIASDNAACYAIYEKGFLHLFDPTAAVLESPSQDLTMEFRRKVRIIVLGMRSLFYGRRFLVPWRHPAFFFQNMSHKIFRWLVPIALVILWVSSALSPAPWAHALFILQCIFYLLAGVGTLYGKGRRVPKVLSIPAYFTAVNLAGLLAWGKFSQNYTLWSPPARDEK